MEELNNLALGPPNSGNVSNSVPTPLGCKKNPEMRFLFILNSENAFAMEPKLITSI